MLFRNFLLTFLVCLLASQAAKSGAVRSINTLLEPGDLFFTSVNSDGDDDFSFVLLVDISGTTTIYFTDNGWNPATSNFSNTSEGTLTWTFTGSLPAGTEVGITDSRLSSIATSHGSIVRSGSFSLSGTGESILAYRGSLGAPDQFIAGFNTRAGGWNSTPGTSSVESGLPSDLTNGTNALATIVHFDDWVYDCSVSSGDKATLLAALTNVTNWVGSETVNPAPACGVSVGSPAPSSATVTVTVFLEGAYNGSSMSTTINADIPLTQPYSFNGHSGGSAASILSGVVDWVLVELRETSGSAATANNASKVGSVAGFLMSDGSIKATNGTSDLTISLSGNTGADFYVVVYHRNHLPIMSANEISESGGVYSIDFTSNSANTYLGGTALAALSGGKLGMIAGDADNNNSIGISDLTNWRSQNGDVFSYGSSTADFNLDGQVNAVDRNDFQQPNSGKSSQVPN
ncbi:MAG: hypothetical protein RIF33_08025 [Cyclobacteriaceae bacterium]